MENWPGCAAGAVAAVKHNRMTIAMFLHFVASSPSLSARLAGGHDHLAGGADGGRPGRSKHQVGTGGLCDDESGRGDTSDQYPVSGTVVEVDGSGRSLDDYRGRRRVAHIG